MDTLSTTEISSKARRAIDAVVSELIGSGTSFEYYALHERGDRGIAAAIETDSDQYLVRNSGATEKDTLRYFSSYRATSAVG